MSKTQQDQSNQALETIITETTATPSASPNAPPVAALATATAATADPHESEPYIQLTGSQVQYERFQPAALAIPPEQIRSARVDVRRVLQNAARGVRAVMARSTEVAKLPDVSIAEITSLARIGEGLAFASTAVEKYLPIVGDATEVMKQARQLRAKLLSKADVLVHDGILEASVVKGIRQGKGMIDASTDLIALAGLFQKNAVAARRSTVIDPIDVSTADNLGRRLLATLRTTRDKKDADPEVIAAMDARDRLWTLFERTWELNVWRAGAHLFLREVDAHVPPLMSAARAKRLVKATPGVGTPTTEPALPQAGQPQPMVTPATGGA